MIDYTKHTLDELYDCLDRIDRDAYPEQIQLIQQEIEKRGGLENEAKTAIIDKGDFLPNQELTDFEREGLKRVRTRVYWMWFGFFLQLVIVVLVLLKPIEIISSLILVMSAPLLAVLIAPGAGSVCPKCNSYFFQKKRFWFIQWWWSRQCVNCGLHFNQLSESVTTKT